MKRQRHSNRKYSSSEEENIRKNLAENPPSSQDIKAMIIALLITIMPIVLLILGIFVLVIWLLFM